MQRSTVRSRWSVWLAGLSGDVARVMLFGGCTTDVPELFVLTLWRRRLDVLSVEVSAARQHALTALASRARARRSRQNPSATHTTCSEKKHGLPFPSAPPYLARAQGRMPNRAPIHSLLPLPVPLGLSLFFFFPSGSSRLERSLEDVGEDLSTARASLGETETSRDEAAAAAAEASARLQASEEQLLRSRREHDLLQAERSVWQVARSGIQEELAKASFGRE